MIKVFVSMLFEFAFSGHIVKGYWLKRMAIKSERSLAPLFLLKTRDREIIFENCLTLNFTML